MNFDEYEKAARATNIAPPGAIHIQALGLCGESGEVADLIKKGLCYHDGVIPPDKMELLKKELGDVLWYIANLAVDCGFTLNEVAELNVKKLADRQKRGVLIGSGDLR